MRSVVVRCPWLPVLLVSASAFADPVGDGLSFLLSRQSPSGAFGETTGEQPVVATYEVLTTLRALSLGQSPEAQSAELYFVTAPVGADSELALRRALALASTPWASQAQSAPTHGPGFEAQDPLHAALTLRALRTPGSLPARAMQDLAFALSRMVISRPDGCYGFADNDPSVDLNAEVVLGLKDYSFDGYVNFSLLAAISCIKAQQRPDGSLGSVGATASGVLALLEAPGDNAASIAAARAFLVASQQADGSWGSVRTTARAIRALAVTSPDWRVTTDELGRPLLVLRDSEPLRGEDILASLDVENRSGSPAGVTSVRFTATPLNGGAAVLLAEAPLHALAPGEAGHVSVLLPSVQLTGRYVLSAAVDPDGLISELDKTNNEANEAVNVRAENDLAVAPGSIRFSALNATQTRVEVVVRNLGVALPAGTTVSVYKGPPSGAGVLIGSANIPTGLAANATHTAAVTWDSQSANGPTPICAVVDPDGLVAEADEANNTAFRFFYPGSSFPADLSVVTADISQSPAVVRSGQLLRLTAMIRNASASDATRVPVALYEQGASTPIAVVELPLVPAQGSAAAELDLSFNGNRVFWVSIDPELTLSDPVRGNNNAMFNASSSATVPVELWAKELSASPVTAQSGGPVSLSVLIQNLGDSSVQTQVRLVDQADGTEWAVVPATFGPARFVPLGTFLSPAHHARLKACVDPFDAETEPNENNNCVELTLGTGTTDLSLHPRDIAFSPAGADVGERLHATALVRNRSATAATALVEWWHGKPESPDGVRVGISPVSVPGNGSGTSEFDWVRADGVAELFARVAQVVPRDVATINNTTGRHLFLEEIVDIGMDDYRLVHEPDVRVARLTGNVEPELVIGYHAYYGPTPGMQSGVAVLQPGAGGHSMLWRFAGQDTFGDVAVADLDGDGPPEVVLVTTRYAVPHTVELDALRPDGTLKWQVSFPGDEQIGGNNRTHLSLGDVNGDGVADVIHQQKSLRAFSGDDGRLLFSTPTYLNGSTGGGNSAVVLDVDGDGANEIFGCNYYCFLLDRTGAFRWHNTVQPRVGEFSVVDLDLDGNPEVVFPGSPLTVIEAANGALFAQRTNGARGWEFASPSAGALRQDGLAYVALGDNSYSAATMAYGPDLSTLWVKSMARPDYLDVYSGTLADLLGLGRPQLIGSSPGRAFTLQDGRNGELLLDVPSAEYAASHFNGRQPVVAGMRGDGRPRVAVGMVGNSLDGWSSDGAPSYGQGVLIFGSPHWKKQPTAWPTRVLRKGQVDENLKVGTDYRWWTTHNTWNQQFDAEPANLLPDLALRAGDVAASPSPGTSGEAATLLATVRNLGGLPASNIAVSFYDGNPSSGGRLLGQAVVAGPLAARTGTGVASFTWTAYPEGWHDLYAVANPEGAIEESGQENNTSSMRLFVRAGTQLCDLSIDAANLSASPAQPLAGEQVSLRATVRNSGVIACAASEVAVYDDPKAAGGVLVGAALVPALGPGDVFTATVSVVASPGTHLFRFVADEAQGVLDADRGNNEATLQLFVPLSAQADLLVASLSAAPNPAYPGEAVLVTALVKNRGAASTATQAQLSSGGVVLARAAVPSLQAGKSAQLSFAVTAPSATSTLLLEVDPSAVVSEFDRANNSAQLALQVTSPGLRLTGQASPASAGPATAIVFSVEAEHSSPVARELFFDAAVVDVNGAEVSRLATGQRTVLAAASSVTFTYAWNTAAHAPGTYLLRVTAAGGGRALAIVDVPVTVLAEESASSVLVTDRGTYGPGREVLLSQRVTNLSRNASLTGALLLIEVKDAAGLVLQASSRQLRSLPPGGYADTADLFHISPQLPPGAYLALSEVRSAEGALLASAQAPWDISYQAADTVTGRLLVASPFQLGVPLLSTVALENAGALPLSGASLQVSLLDATSLALESTATVSVSLAAGQATSLAVPLPTTGILPGEKLVVARLDGKVLDRALALAIVPVDTEPPLILVTGVTDLLLTKQDVSPVIEVQDQSAVQVVALLDLQPFVAGTQVTSEQDHLLEVTAMDAFGNQSYLTIRFTIDRTPPVLTLSGVGNGEVRGASVVLTYSATDLHPGSSSATVDGQPVAPGDTVSAEGEHLWVVSSADEAGNTSTEARAFALDFTAPAIQVTGVADGTYSSAPLTPVVTATDLHQVTLTSTLDGQPFTSGTDVSAEGTYQLLVVATDVAGNESTLQVDFFIDSTPPVITLAGVTDGEYSSTPVTPVITVTDASPFTVDATLDGQPFASGSEVSAEAPHVLSVVVTDAAGNKSTAGASFVLDCTAPAIWVTGIPPGGFASSPPAVSFGAIDANLASVTATVDGAPFISGGTISGEGPHFLEVTAADLAGHTAQQAAGFTVDLTDPVIAVTGVTDGAYLAAPPTVTFEATDVNLAGVSATLDGAAFASGGIVSAEGAHLLAVTAVDLAGRTAFRQVLFTVDSVDPAVTITGVTDGAFYANAVTISFGAADTNLASVSATLDGASFTSGTMVASEGPHLVFVTAADLAGRTATQAAAFTLDFTPPAIQVTGVTDGATSASFTPAFTATDTNLLSVSASLNGSGFASGTTISTPGTYTLVVEAGDASGNQSATTLHFTVAVPMRPGFHFAVCAFGDVTLANNSSVEGPSGAVASVASNGNIELLNNASVSGDVVAHGTVRLINNAVLLGRAYHGGTFTLRNHAVAGSGHQPVAPAPSPCECGFDVDARLADAQADNDNAQLAQLPSIAPFLKNGGLEVTGSAVVTLPAGRYYLSHLLLKNSSRVTVATGGSAELFVARDVEAVNASTLGAPPSAAGALLVVSGAKASLGEKVDIQNNVSASLLLYAPYAKVELSNNAILHGAVVGGQVVLKNNQRLSLSSLVQAAPPPLSCP